MAREISLTKGYVTLVDDEDFDRVSQFSWSALKSSRQVRAYRSYYDESGLRKMQYLHRFILNAGIGEVVDHIDGNSLNNRRDNLRICSGAQNQRNRGKQKNNKSGFKGVYWHRTKLKWRAQIQLNKKNTHLGLYTDPAEAARAYDRAALEMFGEYAVLNFPEEVHM